MKNINENSKVTLTFGQLKRLIKESHSIRPLKRIRESSVESFKAYQIAKKVIGYGGSPTAEEIRDLLKQDCRIKMDHVLDDFALADAEDNNRNVFVKGIVDLDRDENLVAILRIDYYPKYSSFDRSAWIKIRKDSIEFYADSKGFPSQDPLDYLDHGDATVKKVQQLLVKLQDEIDDAVAADTNDAEWKRKKIQADLDWSEWRLSNKRAQRTVDDPYWD